MSYYDTSYPPFLYGLPSSHDLELVGNVQVGTLTVDYSWNSDGKPATIAFGDGTNETTSDESATHTFATHARYMATVVSGNARDSAEIDLTAAADEPEETEETETEETEQEQTFTAIPVDEVPETNE